MQTFFLEFRNLANQYQNPYISQSKQLRSNVSSSTHESIATNEICCSIKGESVYWCVLFSLGR